MSKVLIIGAGGVGGVVAHKAAMEKQVFSDVLLASRTVARCDKLAAEIHQMHGRKIRTAQVDADDVPQLTPLLRDCNAGSHGKAFATNFNPEINIREITARGRYWENGEWKETDPLSVSRVFDYPGVGEKKSFLLYHEELESLVKNIRGLKRIRFWMTFGEAYLKHLEVLQNVGMTRIDEVAFEGHKIVPIKFLRALLPDPASLAPGYTGKTSIGCLCEGVKDGKRKRYFIYNICDHAETYPEAPAQAGPYTPGVPAAPGPA